MEQETKERTDRQQMKGDFSRTVVHDIIANSKERYTYAWRGQEEEDYLLLVDDEGNDDDWEYLDDLQQP